MAAMDRATTVTARSGRGPTTAVAIVGYRLLLYLCSLAVLFGAGAGVAYLTHTWGSVRPTVYWSLLWVMATVAVMMYEPRTWLDPHPGLYRLCFGLAFVAALAFEWGLSQALDRQAQRDRGVVETAVVAAEHSRYSTVSGFRDYRYTLTGADGRQIPLDLWTGGHRLRQGARVSVLVDPNNKIEPSLNLHPSTRGEWVGVGCGVAIGLISLPGLAITAPRRRSSRAAPGVGAVPQR
jgi:hypothetical protein